MDNMPAWVRVALIDAGVELADLDAVALAISKTIEPYVAVLISDARREGYSEGHEVGTSAMADLLTEKILA